MELMTPEIQEQLPPMYATEETEVEDKVAIVKYFTPMSNWTWYGVEYDPETRQFFGYVQGLEAEWGYFSLDELEDLNKSAPVPIVERDLYFKPTKMSELI